MVFAGHDSLMVSLHYLYMYIWSSQELVFIGLVVSKRMDTLKLSLCKLLRMGEKGKVLLLTSMQQLLHIGLSSSKEKVTSV